MTGPGEGKIPLAAEVRFGSRRLDCDVYLHVKGYSLARVTHLDVECDELNLALGPGSREYATAFTAGPALHVRFRRLLRAGPLGYARELVVVCGALAEALGEMRDLVYVGGKEGGIFLGFRREYVKRLEALAERLGVKPRSGRGG